MKTKANEIVKELRDRADQMLEWSAAQYNMDGKLMKEAADMIEAMDERISIMAADLDNEWGKSY
jgi:hypothetical protein